VASTPGGAPTLGRRLAAIHDAITAAGFGLGAVCLAVIVCSFCFEVVARYFLSAPTEWASPVVSYALIAMIFLAVPELTRRAAHISINILLDGLSPEAGAQFTRAIRLVAGIACAFAAWFTADTTLGQFEQGIWTSPPFALPKWVVSIFVPYGLLSSAIYFLRQVLGETPAGQIEGAQP